jgi:hypothetical protein
MSQDPLGNRRGGSATIVVSFQSQTLNVNFEWTVSQLFTKHAELAPPNNPSLLLPTIPITGRTLLANTLYKPGALLVHYCGTSLSLLK